MKYFKPTVLTILLLGFAGFAVAAPSVIYQRTLLPLTNSGEDLGTTTQAWRQIFVGNVNATASSTIGGGTQTTGLTINGGATTTGIGYFASQIGVGTSTPASAFKAVINGTVWITGLGSGNTNTVIGTGYGGSGAGAPNIGDLFNVGSSTTYVPSGGTRGIASTVFYNGPASSASGVAQGINGNAGMGTGATGNLTGTASGGPIRNRFQAFNNSTGYNLAMASAFSGVCVVQGTLASTTNCASLHAESPTIDAGNLITNNYGLWVRGGTPSGTLTNRYGVYIDDLLGGTNRWGVFQEGSSDKNYFNGNTGIGTTSPFATLSIHARPSSTNKTLFAIGSSTASATTTLFNVTNRGIVHAGAASCGTGGLLQYDLQGFEYCGDDNTDTGGVQIISDNNNSGANAWGGFTINNNLADSTFTHFAGFYLNSSNYTSSFFGTALANKNQMILQNTDGLISIISSTSTTALNDAGINFVVGSTAATSEKARIDVEGDFGIGSTSPYAKLSVTNTGSAPSFIVEDSTSPDQTPFIVDASGNVGIGTTTPGANLEVSGGLAAPTATTTIRITGLLNGNWGVGQALGSLDWYGNDLSGGGIGVRARISAVAEISTGANMGLAFLNTTNNAAPTEKMRLTNAGFLGIGSTSPTAALTVVGGMNVSSGSISGYLLGGDVNATTRTPNVRKLMAITVPNYANDDIVEIFSFDSTSAAGANNMSFGGRPSGSNTAATQMYFLTAPNTTTDGGEVRMDIGPTGTTTLIGASALGAVGELRLTSSNNTTRYNNMRYSLNSGTLSYTAFNVHNGTSDTDYTLSTKEVLRLAGTGNAGVGTTSPFAKLSVHAFNGETNKTLFAIGSSTASATTTHFSVGNDGSISASTTLASCAGIQTNANGTMSCTSDARLKDIHGSFTKGLDAILNINPQVYSWKEGTNLYDGGALYHGFVAQDVQKALPEAVKEVNGVLKFQELTVVAALVNAVKEQQRQISNLKIGVVEVTRSVEEDWQNFFIALLLIGLVLQQVQIRRIKK